MSYVASWSGGKDCCLACYEAMRSGLKISHLINFVYEGRVCSHGVSVNLVRLQAELVGIPLVQVETTWEDYEENFKKSVRSLVPQGVRGIVFGDLYLDEHRKWVERVCGELGVEAVEPLWGLKPKEVISHLLDAGFEAMIVSARSNLIGEEWAGCRLSWEFIEYLEERGIDLCGENGEYHTLVVNGPIFRRRLEINFEGVIRMDGRWVAILSLAGDGLAQNV